MATNVKRKKKAEVMSEDGSMTLTGHLKELRNRLIICAVVFVVGVIGFLAVSDKLIDLLTAMARNANYTFVFLAPQEKLMQYFRVSLIAAVVITVPVALYQIYAFAKPGLKRSESFFFKLVLLLGLMLFCIGILFAYKVTLPFMLNFLVTLEGTDYITASISIESYINLCLTMFIIFGCVFEMPLVTIILAKMGIANPEIMKKGRGVAIVLIFLVAAIITPPDIVSQCFVAVPMCLLYFVSIFLSGIFYKPTKTRSALRRARFLCPAAHRTQPRRARDWKNPKKWLPICGRICYNGNKVKRSAGDRCGKGVNES